jgi:hypothetical protein
MAEKGVIPSGSKSVLDEPEKDNSPEKDDKATQDKATEPSTEKKTGGDNDTGSKNYDELKKVFDKQANELGELRKVIQGLQQPAQTQATPATQKPSTNDDLGKILEEYGNLDFYEDDGAAKKGAELMKKAIGLTAQMVKEDTLAEADSKVRSILQEKDMDAVTNKFLQENPDFTELQSQGVFQAFKTQNPLHDDFSAYQAYKRDQAMQQLEEATAALEEAKKVANLAGGDENTAKVFTKPGAELRGQQRPKPKSVSELKQSAMEAVRRATGAG